MHDFYRCEPGYEAMAAQVADTTCRKLVKDMHYKARVQAVITYYADVEKRKIDKDVARNMFLTRKQYLRVNDEITTLFFNLIFWNVIHFATITCRCLRTGAPARARAGRWWWTSGLARSGFRGTTYACNEHGTIYAISSDFGDQMTTQHLD